MLEGILEIAGPGPLPSAPCPRLPALGSLPSAPTVTGIFVPWVLGNLEVHVRLIIVVENQNCQAYLCVFFVFPSSPLSCRSLSPYNKRHWGRGWIIRYSREQTVMILKQPNLSRHWGRGCKQPNNTFHASQYPCFDSKSG